MSRNNSVADETYTLRVYYMRIHEPKDELQPKMNFNNNIIFIFDKGKQLDESDPLNPFVYVCKLVFKMNEGELNVLHQDQMKPIGKYRLEVSHTGKLITINHEDNMERTLDYCFKEKYHFIFNAHFDTRFTYTLPGKKYRIFSKYI
jgi:hypothetical protein